MSPPLPPLLTLGARGRLSIGHGQRLDHLECLGRCVVLGLLRRRALPDELTRPHTQGHEEHGVERRAPVAVLLQEAGESKGNIFFGLGNWYRRYENFFKRYLIEGWNCVLKAEFKQTLLIVFLSN